jgi:hypothetical protein
MQGVPLVSNGIFIANTSFATHLDGARVVVRKGVTRVRSGHSLVTSYPDYFDAVEDAPVHLDVPVSAPDVEQATATPGKKRGEKQV